MPTWEEEEVDFCCLTKVSFGLHPLSVRVLDSQNPCIDVCPVGFIKVVVVWPRVASRCWGTKLPDHSSAAWKSGKLSEVFPALGQQPFQQLVMSPISKWVNMRRLWSRDLQSPSSCGQALIHKQAKAASHRECQASDSGSCSSKLKGSGQVRNA